MNWLPLIVIIVIFITLVFLLTTKDYNSNSDTTDTSDHTGTTDNGTTDNWYHKNQAGGSLSLCETGSQVGPINVGNNADSFFFSPPDITGSCQRYGSPYPDRSSLLAISNNNEDCSTPKVSNLDKLIHPGKIDPTYYYDNPCLTKPPYGTKTAGLEYMMNLNQLTKELYTNCDKYGCPSSNPFNNLSKDKDKNKNKDKDKCETDPLPAIAKTCAFTNLSQQVGQIFRGDAALTRARNDITEEMYHNPTVFCAKNPNHPRCAIFSGLFTPFIGPVEYKNNNNEVVGDGLIPMDKVFPIPRPSQSNVDGFCFETNPFCTLDDTRSVTILQPQMMDPRC
ncbi:MAG: hypothetical protein WD512_15115 [Candidatus Paceibacterota bacterium]